MAEELTPPVPPTPPPPRDPPWGILDALPVAVAAIVLTGVAVAALRNVPGAYFWLLLVFPAFLGGLTLALLALRYPGSRAALRLRSARPAADVVYGIVTGFVLYFMAIIVIASLVLLISLVTGEDATAPRQLDLPTVLSGGNLVLLILSLVVAAPLSEELFFRAFLFRAIRGRASWRLAAALSAALFALFHVSLMLMLPLFVVGIGLAYVYESRSSLLAAIVAHAVFNSIGLASILAFRP